MGAGQLCPGWSGLLGMQGKSCWLLLRSLSFPSREKGLT